MSDEVPPTRHPLVTICGLGPGSADLVTAQTAKLLGAAETVFLRTRHHPSADLASGATSFDDIYERADSFADVYREIADRVVDGALSTGSAVYCVPGSPLILERSVQFLVSRSEVETRLLPAISFLDEVWASLRIDPVDEGVRLIDGHRFAVEAAGERGPLLVAHAHAEWVLSDIKQALVDSGHDDDLAIVVLQRLGTDEEHISEVRLGDLDRSVDADHLTSLFLPRHDAPIAGSLVGSVELMRRLRNECPWDRSQTHGSLRRFLVEEAYEVLDALDRVAELEGDAGSIDDGGPMDDTAVEKVEGELIDAYAELESELGDLLFQILFHARLAAEAGQFDISNVAQTLIDKMIVRHPHVFGTDSPTLFTSPASGQEFEPHDEKQWERLKNQDGQRSSVLDGIPRSMPALARSAKIVKRTTSRFGPADPGPDLQRLSRHSVDADELGALLLAAVELARRNNLDPELALRRAIDRLESQVRALETSGEPDSHWVVG